MPIHPLELDGGRGTVQLRETPGDLSGSGSGTHQDFSPVDATRCYLIQMLGWVLTCVNDCSCWSADEENSPGVFLTMDALYRLS